MKVKVKNFCNKEGIMPKKAYPNDFCYDVYAVSEEKLAPGVYKYGIGLGFQIERGDEVLIKDVMNMFGSPTWTGCTIDMKRCPLNLSIDLRPRSSVWKTGMVLSNCVGTIDEGYTNEISAIFYHVMPTMPRYRVGDRIGQVKIGVTLPIEFEEVEELNKTDRGLNGYGSSGK